MKSLLALSLFLVSLNGLACESTSHPAHDLIDESEVADDLIDEKTDLDLIESDIDNTSDLAVDEVESLPPTRLYITLVAHNEDTNAGNNPDCLALFSQLDTRWEANRQALIDIVDVVEAKGAALSLQSDVEFLEIVQQRESAQENFLRSLASRPAGRFTVDAHAHETATKNYADVANLVEHVTGIRNGVVGGFTATTCRPDAAPPTWEKFRQPLSPIGPGPDFVASVLTDGASAGHVCDPSVSGIWRPSSPEDYFTDDPNQDLATIGQGLLGSDLDQAVDDIEALLAAIRQGQRPQGHLYTANITILQCNFDLADSGHAVDDIATFIDAVNALDNGSGDLQWATFDQVVEIWHSDYQTQPSVWDPSE